MFALGTSSQLQSSDHRDLLRLSDVLPVWAGPGLRAIDAIAPSEVVRAGRAGQRVGRYRIQRMLEQGGAGAVYEAVHASIGQRVAIKILHAAASAGLDLLEQVRHEASAVNQVDHPGLVRVMDSGILPDGAAYLVMELLDGESLHARLHRRGHPLPARDAVRLMRQTASVLTAAHARGVLHLDLKPENLFVVFDPEVHGGERIKLLDFGLAQVNAVRPQGLKGLRAGTPLYMAPEQWLARDLLCARTDVYALGVILFQTLVGRPPFCGPNPEGLMMMHRFACPPTLAALCPDLPAELGELIDRMLAKEPAQRPAAAEVAATLLRLQDQVSPVDLWSHEIASDDALPMLPTLIEGALGAVPRTATISFNDTLTLSRRVPGMR